MCQQLLSALGYHVLVPDYRGWCRWNYRTRHLKILTITIWHSLCTDCPIHPRHIDLTTSLITVVPDELFILRQSKDNGSASGQGPVQCMLPLPSLPSPPLSSPPFPPLSHPPGAAATWWQWKAALCLSAAAAAVDVWNSVRVRRFNRGADWSRVHLWYHLLIQLGQSALWRQPGRHLGALAWHWVSEI